ncbi:LacI family DNA-binding transcriptional regulator [Paenibacillus herberti]|nr:LacI family DNA-binding transcriptional regulator [Paenibacillus herberti]
MSRSRVTIKDVAKLAEVSIATVSNVINGTGRVSLDTQRKVEQAIGELDFAPSASARNLKDKKSSLIAVIVPLLEKGRLQDNPFYWHLVRGIEESARDEKLHVILVGIGPDESFSFIREQHLDGLIFVGAFEDTEVVESVLRLNVPCVFMDSLIDNSDFYQVSLDDELGGYIGTKHLLSLGHERIVLLTGLLKKDGVNYCRWQGYRRALEEAGVPYRPELVYEEPTSSLGGYRAASRIGAKGGGVTAVFALSDMVAIGLIKGLHDLGIQVPRDMSIVGFDDDERARYCIPALTTVRQDIVQKGRTAVRLLTAQIERDHSVERQVTLGVELVPRQSTAPLAARVKD